MNLTTEQLKLFWREWPKACRANQWTDKAEIESRRKELLARCGFDSLTKVDRLDGFTKLINEVRVLQGVSLQAGLEAGDPTLNQARVLRHFILTDQIPCLEVYIDDPKAYLTAIMADKNRWWRIDRPVRDITLMDLDARPVRRWSVRNRQMEEFPSQLEQMRFTLAARINALRKAAGDTVHDMRRRAGLPCACAKCSQAVVALETAPENPVPAEMPF